MARARNWCFTLHDYTDEEATTLATQPCRYTIIGKEICPSTGKQHLQGYIQYDNAKTMTSIKKSTKINRIHLEIAKGSTDQNQQYCKKENDFIEIGKAKQQGQRNDIHTIKNAIINDNATMREIIPIATSIQSIRMAEICLKYYEPKRDWKPYVEWFYGATGTGKTKRAHDKLEEPYVSMDTGQWWEGYDAHEHVIIDDMRKDFMKFHQLLKLLDRYPYQIECKGGSRQFLAKHIIITSAYHPQQLFNTREDIQQLIRRIDNIEEFK